uniref:Uncharacterized protein n=1 Tax=Sphaerodactylus townsendi TaxID=933632 RepID=A0ACB8FGB7_9SAUR
MDFLNFTESFKHHYRAYCGWSYMMRPFYEMNITKELDNPRFHELASHVDPLEYNQRYANVTKYIIVLSGDEFFPPDNSRFYFSQLEGKKRLLIMPNTDYGNLRKNELTERIASFYFTMVQKIHEPLKISWKMNMTNTSGTISVTAYNTYRVYSQHADTVGNTRRDFRMKIAAGNSSQDNPVKWIQTDVKEVVSISPGLYLLIWEHVAAL